MQAIETETAPDNGGRSSPADEDLPPYQPGQGERHHAESPERKLSKDLTSWKGSSLQSNTGLNIKIYHRRVFIQSIQMLIALMLSAPLCVCVKVPHCLVANRSDSTSANAYWITHCHIDQRVHL